MTHDQGLKKKIGVFTLVSLGVGSMVGSGIFAVPAAMAAVAGPGLILAIFLCGMITTLLAMAYAELGAAFPLTGGPYAFPKLAMGEFNGFIMGWGYFLYMFVGTAAIIDIFIVYLGFYIPGLAEGQTLTGLGILVALAALWIFTIINIVGVEWGGMYSVITTIGKLVPMLLFILIGLAFMDGVNFVPFVPFGFGGIALSMTLFFWSYTGFESIVVPTGEMRNPARTIPISMFLTMFIAIIIYVAVAIVFVGMIDWNGLNFSVDSWQSVAKLSSPLSSVALAKGLPWLAVIATIGAIIATAGAGGDWVLLQGRVPFAMAQDKLFWPVIAKVHPKYKTPVLSIIMASILTSLILILIPSFPSVALVASITAVVPYAAATLSVPILRKTKPDVPRPFKLPMHKFITLLGFILATLLIYWAAWPWTLVGMVLILLGYPAYLFVARSFDFKRNAWIIVYLLGIVIVSLLGDPQFTLDNFTKLAPLGLIKMPYDIVILALFATVIYFWAYSYNVKHPVTDSNTESDR